MRISASVASVPDSQLADVVRQMDDAGVDAYHLDSIDEPQIFDFAKHLRRFTQTPFDLHLITGNPELYWDFIRESGINQTVFQLEALQKPLFIPEDLKGKIGIAVQSTTNPDKLSVYAREAAYLLVMLTTPGKSGGAFQPSAFAGIIRYRERYPDIPMIIDGGVNPEVASVLRMMGITTVVSGSFLFSQSRIQDAISMLHQAFPVRWTLGEVMDPGVSVFTETRQSFGIQADCFGFNAAAQFEALGTSENEERLREQISKYHETGGRALLAPETTPLQLLYHAAQALDKAPRCVFALDAKGQISGSFFIQPEHDSAT